MLSSLYWLAKIHLADSNRVVLSVSFIPWHRFILYGCIPNERKMRAALLCGMPVSFATADVLAWLWILFNCNLESEHVTKYLRLSMREGLPIDAMWCNDFVDLNFLISFIRFCLEKGFLRSWCAVTHHAYNILSQSQWTFEKNDYSSAKLLFARHCGIIDIS